MTDLTLRRAPDHPNHWHVYFGDVRVGYIGEQPRVPNDRNQWGWECGFFPGGPKSKGGDGPDFEACKQAFQRAWNEMLPHVSEQGLEESREHRDWTAWKYRMHDSALPMPAQGADGRARCFCGAEIKIAKRISK
jgi:hypothetical protein